MKLTLLMLLLAFSATAQELGQVATFAHSNLSSSWIPCDGRYLNENDYPDLHSLIGNTYTTVVKQDSFQVPDLRDRFVLSVSANNLGVKGGTDSVAIEQVNLPDVDFAVNGSIRICLNEEDPNKTEGKYTALGNAETIAGSMYNTDQVDTSNYLNLNTVQHTLTANSGGGNKKVSIKPKYIGLIKAIRVYP